jgi:hypothetical protein
VRPSDKDSDAVRVRFRLADWGPIREDLNQSARKGACDCDCLRGCVDITGRWIEL